MSQQFPPGQGPVDPRPAFMPPPPPTGGWPQGFPPPPGSPGFTPPGGQRPGGWMPPPGFGPPMMMPPGFRPPRSGGGIFRAVLTLLLIVILLDVVGLNIMIFGAATMSSSGTLIKQVTVTEGSSQDTIAAIPINGIITDETAKEFDEFLTTADKDKTVKAVVLEIDTPGGSATASDEMYHRLDQFKRETKDDNRNIPIIVSMGGMATSGGYYVACGGDYIFAQPATMTANIGVIFPRFNISDLMNKYGVHETTIVATGGVFKNAGSMFEPENEKDRAYLQGLVDVTFDRFKQVVNDGRKGKLTGNPTDIFNGRVYMAADAMKLGLIDKIGYRDDAYAYAKSTLGLSNMKVVRYQEPATLLKLLSAESQSNTGGGQTSAGDKGLTINGVNVDAKALMDLFSSRPMYLWRGN